MKQDRSLGIDIEHVNKGAFITRGIEWPDGKRPILAMHPEGLFIPSIGIGGLKGYKSTMEAVDAIVWYKFNYSSQALLEGSAITTGIALDTKAKNLDLDRDEWTIAKDRVGVWEQVDLLGLPPQAILRVAVLSRLERKPTGLPSLAILRETVSNTLERKAKK